MKLAKIKNALYICLCIPAFLFSSCEQDDDKLIVLPPLDTTMVYQSVSIGVNNDTMIFVDLSTGVTTAMPTKIYDLAFEASASGQYIYLNTSKYMFAYRTQFTDFLLADSSGLNWATDGDTWEGDSTAFGKNTVASGAVNNKVVILDLGKYDHTGADRFRKFQVTEINADHYLIKYCKLNNSDYHEFTVTKDAAYSLMYFSFENGGQMVTVAPPKNLWDFVFTRYVHTYWDQPIAFRYYFVNGTMLNIWAGITSAMLKKDSLPNYKPFSEFTSADINNYPYTSVANQMGFDWKYYDFNANHYNVWPDQYYIISDSETKYFKLQYTDFYNTLGEARHPTYQYQRIY